MATILLPREVRVVAPREARAPAVAPRAPRVVPRAPREVTVDLVEDLVVLDVAPLVDIRTLPTSAYTGFSFFGIDGDNSTAVVPIEGSGSLNTTKPGSTIRILEDET